MVYMDCMVFIVEMVYKLLNDMRGTPCLYSLHALNGIHGLIVSMEHNLIIVISPD